jgi:hypothetical protein
MSRVLRVIGCGESSEEAAVIGFGGGGVFRRKKEKRFISKKFGRKLWEIRREVNLIANREIQHIVRADLHRIRSARFKWIALTGMTSDLIL